VKSRERGEIRNGCLPSSPSCRLWATPLPAKTPKNATNKSVLALFSDRLLFLLLVQICCSLCKFFCFLFFCFCFRWPVARPKGCRSVGAAGLLWSCCRRGTERRLGRRQRGCRCVRLVEARSCCGAGLLCKWPLLFRKPKGKQTLLMGKETLLLEVWVSVEAGLGERLGKGIAGRWRWKWRPGDGRRESKS